MFFREPSQFTAIERAALERCTDHVLDAGAGTGLHSLVLQQKGLQVTAIDFIPAAVEIMARRGVKDARCVDLFDYEDAGFDTILMMGNGIGLVETIAGKGPYCGWLHIDSLTLKEHAANVGWRCEVITEYENGNFLAQIASEGLQWQPSSSGNLNVCLSSKLSLVHRAGDDGQEGCKDL